MPMKREPRIRPTCGSRRGYYQHVKRHESPCDRCREANSAYQRDYRSGEDLRAHRSKRVTTRSIQQRQMEKGQAFMAMSDEALAAFAAEQEQQED